MRTAIGRVVLLAATVIGFSTAMARSASADTAYQPYVNMGSGDCLAVAAGNMTNGTPIVPYPCDGSPNQNWSHADVGWSVWRNGANHDKCLALAGNSNQQGAKMVIWDCQLTTSGQLWNFENNGRAMWLHIYNHQTGSTFALTGWGTTVYQDYWSNWGWNYQAWLAQ